MESKIRYLQDIEQYFIHNFSKKIGDIWLWLILTNDCLGLVNGGVFLEAMNQYLIWVLVLAKIE